MTVLRLFLLCLLTTSFAYAQPSSIQVSENHSQYWTYKGETILLLGGTDEDNLFQMPNVEAHLQKLQSVGGNYVRCTMSSRDEGDVWAFYFDEEKGKYDLTRWNETYWNRFANFLKVCNELDIIVQIELWATFDFYRDNWDNNPFNPKMNATYTAARVDLPDTIATHPVFTDNPFFKSVPMLDNNMRLLEFQQKFVEQLLSFQFSVRQYFVLHRQ